MFGIGFMEIIIIAIAAIVIIKPNDWPALIRKMGRLYGKFQRLYYTFMNYIQELSDTETNKHGSSDD